MTSLQRRVLRIVARRPSTLAVLAGHLDTPREMLRPVVESLLHAGELKQTDYGAYAAPGAVPASASTNPVEALAERVVDLLEALPGGLRDHELLAELECSRAELRRATTMLRQRGVAARDERRRWFHAAAHKTPVDLTEQPPKPPELSSVERAVLSHVRRSPGASVVATAHELDMGRNKITPCMRRLLELGLVERRGKGAGTRYHPQGDSDA